MEDKKSCAPKKQTPRPRRKRRGRACGRKIRSWRFAGSTRHGNYFGDRPSAARESLVAPTSSRVLVKFLRRPRMRLYRRTTSYSRLTRHALCPSISPNAVLGPDKSARIKLNISRVLLVYVPLKRAFVGSSEKHGALSVFWAIRHSDARGNGNDSRTINFYKL